MMENKKFKAEFLPQLRATLIRNILRKKRNKRHMLKEVLGPIYMMSIVIILKHIMTSNQTTDYGIFDNPPGPVDVINHYSVKELQLQVDIKDSYLHPNSTIAVVPQNDGTTKLVEVLRKKLPDVEFLYFQDEDEMNKIQQENQTDFRINLALVFTDLEDRLEYKIRVNPIEFPLNILPDPNQLWASKESCRGGSVTLESGATCPANSYWGAGFTTLQYLLDQAWLMQDNSSLEIPRIKVRQLPKRAYSGYSTTVMTVFRSTVPIYITISMSMFISPMLTVVVDEKEKKIKETLKMVGLRDSVFWLSWFIVYAVLILVTSLLGSTLISFLVFTSSTFFLVTFSMMLLFGLTIIMFAFMLTALFSKAKTAATVGGLSTMAFTMLYYIQVFVEGDNVAAYWLMGLSSPTAFALGIDTIMQFDFMNLGYSNDILWSTEYSKIPIGGLMIMLAVDTVLYGMLAVWLDNIVPTEYGTRRVPWFCFQPGYWMSYSLAPVKQSLLPLSQCSDIEPVHPSVASTAQIQIRNLRKVFTKRLSRGGRQSRVVAVDGVSLDVYPGEITAILGHNGAGKTTLFNMLTGMTSVTTGEARIFGYNVKNPNEMNEIRKLTGICPQHDVLFDELTPREHLKFYARIRGIPEERLEEEVDNILVDVDMTGKAEELVKTLSGGQKRKLSVGVALIGDPKLIFLDEPTSGVDAYSRRHLWSVLKRRSEGKIILLTTHFMDEADILADRKAIMSRGRVRCYGTSSFLKTKFGIGYHLTLVMKNTARTRTIEELVSRTVKGSYLGRNHGQELSFVLPLTEIESFPVLFKKIEDDISEEGNLGVSSYGVSMTSLEEVFLRLGEEEDFSSDSYDKSDLNSETSQDQETQEVSVRVEEDMFLPSGTSDRSIWRQFRVMVGVRILNKLREPSAIFAQIVLPVIYICLGIFLQSSYSSQIGNDDTAVLTADIYKNSFQPNVLGVQNVTEDFSDFIENFTGTTVKNIDADVNFKDLISQNLMGVIKNESYGELVGYFNSSSQHSMPILINLMTNYYSSLRDSGTISLSTQSFSVKVDNLETTEIFMTFGACLLIGMSYALAPLGMALELIYDRSVGLKNQLRVNGLSTWLYYGSFFFVLSLLMILLLAMLIIVIAAFQVELLLIPGAAIVLCSLYLLYILPSLIFVGCLSFMFNTMESGQNIYMFSSIAGMIPFFIVSLIEIIGIVEPGWSSTLPQVLHFIFAFISPIYIPFGVIFYIQKVYIVCSFETPLVGCDKTKLSISDYMVPELYVIYIALIFHGVVWTLLLIVLDHLKNGGSLKNLITKEPLNENTDVIENEDTDVKNERNLVKNYMERGNPNIHPVLSVYNLRKVYQQSKLSFLRKKKEARKVAVRSLSLLVREGEVLGLLGHNGAGKTSAMKMVTAEEAVSAGRVEITGKEVRSRQSKVYDQLGYCPQTDTVWPRLSLKEHLRLFARIRGVPEQDIAGLVNSYLAGLHIQEHGEKASKDCSGGTKRKLCYGIAMVGSPKIVLLDEPSTGMDPQSKRFVWNTISSSFKAGRGAVLTTHSMEEADAVCSRIGILVQGELRCLGSSQHLKNKFGAGYLLEIKTLNWEQLEGEVSDLFPEAELVQSFPGSRVWSIKQSDVPSLTQAFVALQKLKNEHEFEDYSFSQTTLEQVFIKFAKQQEEADEEDQEEM